MQLSINLLLVFLKTCTNFLIRKWRDCPQPHHWQWFIFIFFLIFSLNFMFWMGLSCAMCMCRWGEVLPPFPAAFSMLSFWGHTTCFIFICLLFLCKFLFLQSFQPHQDSPHFSSHWPGGDSQRIISKVLSLPWDHWGKLHRWGACPFVLSFASWLPLAKRSQASTAAVHTSEASSSGSPMKAFHYH